MTINLGGGRTLTNAGLLQDIGTGGLTIASTVVDQSAGGSLIATGTSAAIKTIKRWWRQKQRLTHGFR